MLARITTMTLVIGLALTVVPAPAAPVEEASAVPACMMGPTGEVCVDSCDAVYLYNTVRNSNKATEELLPWAACQY